MTHSNLKHVTHINIMETIKHKPLDLQEKESISVLNPNPEPLPKPPPPPPDMLISLKLLSILPEPIDCKDINPPLSPLPLSICRIRIRILERTAQYRKSMKRRKLGQEPMQGLKNYLAFVNLTGLALHNILGFIDLALQYQLVQLLFMTLHLTVLLNLCNSYIFLVPKRDDFIKSKNQLKSCLAYTLFI